MPTLAGPDDVDVYFTDHGTGPAVLMLHGWACDGNDWSWLAADLSTDHRVIVVDQRGHGRSTGTAGAFGAKVMAADAARVLHHLQVPEAVVVGHSMGTLVGSALAVEHPALVSALVLSDPVYGISDEFLSWLIPAMRRQPLETALSVFDGFYIPESPRWMRIWHERRLRGTPPHVLAEAFCALFEGTDGIGQRSVAATYLPRRRCPVLAVYSAAVAAQTGPWEELAPHGPEDRTVVWDDAGHFPHQEHPQRFADLARAWLEVLPSRDRRHGTGAFAASPDAG